MIRRSVARLAVACTGVVALLVAGQTAAYAAPTNDDFSAATTVGTTPFTTTIDTTGATTDPTDPTGCANRGSVWFNFTPTVDGRVEAHTYGSDYYSVLSAWTGEQGSLTRVACNDDNGSQRSRIRFAVTAGTTYHLMVGTGGFGDSIGGSLRFSLDQAVAPANDDFADAITVGALPYADTRNYAGATAETGEPSFHVSSAHTAWYAYTPTSTGSVTARTNPGYAGIAAYTGSSLTTLSLVGYTSLYDYDPLTFVAQAGRTYLFQVGSDGSSAHTFQLDVAADPTVDFYHYPSEPSSYDQVSLGSSAYDPAGAGIASFAWDFGDGTTSTEPYPVHRFPGDGDWTVRLSVRTVDGRTASVSHVVSVRTHDVAVVKLTVPATARVGQTIGVTVQVRNTRYDENVRVDLERSTPTGYVSVGSSTRPVPASDSGKTTRFVIDYPVTAEDLAVGKVSFRAVAELLDARDALPYDNELRSAPVKVA
ncbi:PKD domain-containing protein [Micromonospora sp. CPCC 206171]|uniref:PKD domain-containing protein n=1 Tax=Micromonospora sp. CPCC 206171 TaxID=3122405 RepID=UPI002FF3D9EE